MPPGAASSVSRRPARSAIDSSRLAAMAAKCCSSSAISAGSALAARRLGRLNALVGGPPAGGGGLDIDAMPPFPGGLAQVRAAREVEEHGPGGGHEFGEAGGAL